MNNRVSKCNAPLRLQMQTHLMHIQTELYGLQNSAGYVALLTIIILLDIHGLYNIQFLAFITSITGKISAASLISIIRRISGLNPDIRSLPRNNALAVGPNWLALSKPSLPTYITWYLYEKVSQNMLRTYEVKQVFSEKSLI